MVRSSQTTVGRSGDCNSQVENGPCPELSSVKVALSSKILLTPVITVFLQTSVKGQTGMVPNPDVGGWGDSVWPSGPNPGSLGYEGAMPGLEWSILVGGGNAGPLGTNPGM